MGEVVTRSAESAFYDAVAKRLGKEKLELWECDAVFTVRLNCCLNHQLHGPSDSPFPNNDLVTAAWNTTLDMLNNNGKLVT